MNCTDLDRAVEEVVQGIQTDVGFESSYLSPD